MNKEAKLYYQTLKLFIPIHGKIEKRLLQEMKQRILECVEENPSINYDELCEILGNPQDISSEYFSTIDSAYISKYLRLAKYVKLCIIILVFLCTLLSFTRIYYLQQENIQYKNSLITYEETTIK